MSAIHSPVRNVAGSIDSSSTHRPASRNHTPRHKNVGISIVKINIEFYCDFLVAGGGVNKHYTHYFTYTRTTNHRLSSHIYFYTIILFSTQHQIAEEKNTHTHIFYERITFLIELSARIQTNKKIERNRRNTQLKHSEIEEEKSKIHWKNKQAGVCRRNSVRIERNIRGIFPSRLRASIGRVNPSFVHNVPSRPNAEEFGSTATAEIEYQPGGERPPCATGL